MAQPIKGQRPGRNPVPAWWFVSNGSAPVVSGSIAWTESDDTASLAGAVTVNGTAAWTESDDTAALVGAVQVNGTVAWTEDDDQWALSGTVGSITPPTSSSSGGGGGVWVFENTRERQEENELLMLVNAFLEVV